MNRARLLVSQLIERLPVALSETEQFLRARNARLNVQDANSGSFYVTRFNATTDVNAFGRKLRIKVKHLDEKTLQLAVRDLATNRGLVDIAVAIDDDDGQLYLNFDDIRLTIELDAVPGRSSSE